MSYTAAVVLYLLYVLFTYTTILWPLCACISKAPCSKFMGIWLLVGAHAVWMLSAFFMTGIFGLS